MQLDALRLFCAIIETGSVTAGAAKVHISQSAASQQIRAMEQRLGHQLLERGAHGVRPTSAGTMVFHAFHDMLDRYDGMVQQLQEISRSVAGIIRVATIYSVGLHDLPPYIKRFLQLHPNCGVHLEYERSDRIYEMVAQGNFDLGIVAYPQESRRLEVIPMSGDQMVVVMHPEHPLARARSVRPVDLNGQKLVAFARDIPTRRALDRLLARHQIEVEVVIELDNVETIKQSVEAELGISIIPRRCATHETEAGTLKAIPLDAEGFWRPVGILHRRGRSLPPAVQHFIALVTASGAEAVL